MHKLNRVHLGGLRAVEAAGRLGSLRAAADELGVTIGAVSQQVRKIERQLGRILFERLPNGIRPTPLGEEVLIRLTSGMAELAAAVALAERGDEKVLTVSAAPVFAGKWLVWRLQRFNQRHPDIHIRIDANFALVDPNVSDVDVCIRVGRGDWPGVAAEKILDQRVFPVCSPAIAEDLRDPADLRSVPIIRDEWAMFDWDVWLQPNGLDASILGDGPVFSDASLCLDASIAGQGVFLAWETLAGHALSVGSLVTPLPGRYQNGIAYWIVTGQDRGSRPPIRAFRRWLAEELSASVPLGVEVKG